MIVSEAEAALEFCVKTELSTPVLIADIGGTHLNIIWEQLNAKYLTLLLLLDSIALAN